MEFIIAVSILGLSIVMNMWVIGASLTGLTLWLMKRLKRGTKRGAAQHALWASGLSIDRAMGAFPPAWDNEFME